MRQHTLLTIFAFICIVGTITANDDTEAVAFGLIAVFMQGLAAFVVWADKRDQR